MHKRLDNEEILKYVKLVTEASSQPRSQPRRHRSKSRMYLLEAEEDNNGYVLPDEYYIDPRQDYEETVYDDDEFYELNEFYEPDNVPLSNRFNRDRVYIPNGRG